MAAITPGRRALHYQWGQQSVLCLHWGDNTLTPNSVNQPSGFLSNGKDSQIKSSMFCMPVTVCHTGESGAHRKQTLGQMELFIQLYTLFGRSMSFLIARPFAVCHGESLILNCCSEAGGVYPLFLQASGFFLRSTQSQDRPIKLLFILLGQLSYSWNSSWPQKRKNYSNSNYLWCENNNCLFLPSFFSTACGKDRQLSPASSNIAPLNVDFLKDRYYWNTSGNSWALHLHWLGFEPWNWGWWTTTMLV